MSMVKKWKGIFQVFTKNRVPVILIDFFLVTCSNLIALSVASNLDLETDPITVNTSRL